MVSTLILVSNFILRSSLVSLALFISFGKIINNFYLEYVFFFFFFLILES